MRFLGFSCRITDSHDEIRAADRIIFPGVGAAGKSMADLVDLGLDTLIKERFSAGIPIMGICVGLQVLFDYSEENDTKCLGILPGRVRLFPRNMPSESGVPYKIPHMGWNTLEFRDRHPLLEKIEPKSYVYFVHSYHVSECSPSQLVACTNYGVEFPAVVCFNNIVGVQFHPEKSSRIGLQLLSNFRELVRNGSHSGN